MNFVFDQSEHLFTFWRYANQNAYIFTTSGLDAYFNTKITVVNTISFQGSSLFRRKDPGNSWSRGTQSMPIRRLDARHDSGETE